MSTLGDDLWNAEVGPDDYADARERYQSVVFEQYKLCVEMADRVSGRRNLSNTFFLTLNSAVATTGAALAAGYGGTGKASAWLLSAILVVLVAQCLAWFAIVRSYRLLNAAKYAVIGAFEERLPAYAYSRAEWRELGEGHDWRKYLPLTHIEQWVPGIFAAAYVFVFLAFIL